MAVVAVSATSVAFLVMYRDRLADDRAHLIEIVKSRATVIEAMARFDKVYSAEDVEGGAFAATLDQLR